MFAQKYDVAVLGGGPGGNAAALRAATRGAKVCCIEAGTLGGTCLNVGCIPTKAMLHASELYWQMTRSGEFGISAGQVAVDAAKFTAGTKRTVETLRKGLAFLYDKRKVDIIAGRGRLTSPNTISVETPDGVAEIQAKSIIIATGSRPARPGFVPWESPLVMTTDEATTADTLPASVIIVGGGVIGCEFATVYSELGITTTVIEMLDNLLPGLDAEASKTANRSLTKRGAKILTGSKITSMSANAGGVTAKLADGKSVRAAAALIAVGRVANIENIGLEQLGIAVEGGVIKVDDHCRTNVTGVYAVGDCAEKIQYAHLAGRMGTVAADNATGHDASDPRDLVPACVYTHPEIATVGRCEAGDGAVVSKFPYQASGLARVHGATEGFIRLVSQSGSGRVLGGVVIGPHATDIIAEIALAVRHGLTVADVAETIHAHPTFAEGVCEAAEIALGLPIHTLG